MKTAVIVDSVRTGLAKSHRGGFNMTRADDMLAHIINSMLDRNPNLPPEMVEDVIMGCGNPEGAMGHNIGRNAAVLSNLPITVGGTTVNRYCSSGLTAGNTSGSAGTTGSTSLVEPISPVELFVLDVAPSLSSTIASVLDTLSPA